MDGFSFYRNVSNLGLQDDTATPSNVISAMPTRSILLTNINSLTNPAWNFPNSASGRHFLEIVNSSEGRTLITLYGKTSSDADYRMFLNSGDNFPTGQWVKLLTNADLDGVLVTTTSGATAIEAGLGDTRYRLQINPSGNVVLYQSTDGGNSWPNTKNVFSFN